MTSAGRALQSLTAVGIKENYVLGEVSSEELKSCWMVVPQPCVCQEGQVLVFVDGDEVVGDLEQHGFEACVPISLADEVGRGLPYKYSHSIIHHPCELRVCECIVSPLHNLSLQLH